MSVNISAIPARDAIIDRLLDWHEQAKSAGRTDRADALLALAWYVYDGPLAAHTPVDKSWNGYGRMPGQSQFRPCSAAILQAFPGLADLSKGVEVRI
jgi:phage tail protein X